LSFRHCTLANWANVKAMAMEMARRSAEAGPLREQVTILCCSRQQEEQSQPSICIRFQDAFTPGTAAQGSGWNNSSPKYAIGTSHQKIICTLRGKLGEVYLCGSFFVHIFNRTRDLACTTGHRVDYWHEKAVPFLNWYMSLTRLA